jgi:hypothetical protein
MSGEHSIHVRIDTASPRWQSGYYRFEQHYNFLLPNEQDVQYALAQIADLCEQLRTPPRDEIPPADAPLTEQLLADMPPADVAVGRVKRALEATERHLGGPADMGDSVESRLERMQLFLSYLHLAGG